MRHPYYPSEADIPTRPRAREVIACLAVVVALAAVGGTLDHWGDQEPTDRPTREVVAP